MPYLRKGFPFFFFCLFLNVPSTCNAGEPGSVPGSGRSPGEGNRLPTPVFLGFPFGSAGKESACNVGDLGSIPGLGRSPGEGNGYPLQYSGLKNSMDSIVHGVTESDTRDLHLISSQVTGLLILMGFSGPFNLASLVSWLLLLL